MTKPIETLRRGNGGRRLNKVEKDDPTAALANRAKINGRGACKWAEGCVWNGVLIDGLCAEHRSEMLRVERVRRWQEGKSKPTPPPEYRPDHTAPWQCRVGSRCKVCAKKPTYEEWASGS